MKLSNPRAIAAMLALPTYIWVKAISHTYFHHDFMPETDVYIPVLFAAIGLVPKKEEG